jgi:hypothetical protein
MTMVSFLIVSIFSFLNINDTSVGNQIQELIVGYLDIVKHCQSNVTNGIFVLGISYNDTDTLNQISSINQQIMSIDPNHTNYNYNITNVNEALNLPFIVSNQTLWNTIALAINISYALNTIALNLPVQNNCSFVGQAYDTIQQNYCINSQNALDVTWVVFFILGIINIFVIIFAGLGYKRFRKRKYVLPKIKNDRKSGVFVEMVNTV